MKKFLLVIFSIIFITVFCLSCTKSTKSTKQVKEITYWQFWTGFEGKAIEHVVNKFNKEHSDIKVKMLTISEPWKKTLLSIIGGTPPDVISIVAEWIPELSIRGAILPLNKYCNEYMISKDLFIPVYWDILNHKDKIWALPTTPTSTALYWNKELFKQAGLDPESPPKTLEELWSFAKKLTKHKKDGSLQQIGFLPSWPPWAFGFYGYLFGGEWTDTKTGNATANNLQNIKAWQWAQSYAKELGSQNIQSFQEEFGNYQGPNNPFYTEKIAIEVNGVWEGNFIEHFAPHIKWGAAPMPNKKGEPITIVNCDCIVIPKGSKHPDEAFYFINWLLKKENIEELCIRQKKFSPLIASDRSDFIQKHPNPYIKVFIDLAKLKNAVFFPTTTAYQLYKRELKRAFEAVMRLDKEPKQALDEVQEKIEQELARQQKYEELRG